MSDNGHSEEIHNRIRVDDHQSGLPKGHFYGASGGGSTGKWIGHKGNFLEGGIRVPAVISYPARLPQGAVRGQIVTAMDWYPTVLQLCGVQRPPTDPPLDGHSLLPLIASATAKSEYRDVLHFQWGKKWAARDGDWKLIAVDGKPSATLHRLSDPRPEVRDYAEENPAVVARLRALHAAWAADVSP